jgi:protein-S-isoprenylcysteine O-methyltransferase Ste14
VFEKVIQEVCDSSQVDFEESGVDQKTLHDLRDVSFLSLVLISWALMAVGVLGSGWSAKSGGARSAKEAVLMGEHRHLRHPLYVAAATRFLGLRPPSYHSPTVIAYFPRISY